LGKRNKGDDAKKPEIKETKIEPELKEKIEELINN